MATIEDFETLDIRVGTVVEAELLEDGKYSTHKLKIDFGEDLGIKKSCARLTHYTVDDLIGRQVLAVVNFPPRQVGKAMSEVLTLGVPRADGECALIQPDQDVEPGVRLF
ncbi:tRNA-binding protein [Candidatus Peregrinibacteria bacterium]|nr:MAG: tRNA-binding protein [Candidatus Peregrinibacteria bacterium]